MAKDPAFPLYTQDFLVGTMFMDDTEVGIYMRLLCVQHQHGGIIDKQTFNDKTEKYPKVKAKFIETEGGFFNERLMREMEKRTIKSNNLSENAKLRWAKVKQSQCKSNAKALEKKMPTEDEIEIEYNTGGDGGELIVKFAQFFPNKFINNKDFIIAWQKWIAFNDERETPVKPTQAREQLKYLTDIENPIKLIELSITNNWKGLKYENKPEKPKEPEKHYKTTEQLKQDLYGKR